MIRKIVQIVTVASALLFASSALAANFTNVAFDNGDVTISGQGGSSVNATLHLTVPANQVVEYIETDVIGDSLAPVCTQVGGDLGLQEGTHDVTVPVTLPPNTGTYTLQVKGAGIYGGIRSVDCNDNVVGSAAFGNALRTVSNSDSTTTTGSTGSMPSWLAALIALLHPATPAPAPTPVPTTSAVCTEFSSDLSTVSMGSTGDNVAKLQAFLLSKDPNSIPLIRSGAAKYGYFGSQTNSAVIAFRSNPTYNCQ